MKKLLMLAAMVGGFVALSNKRKKEAEAEARLWDEATGRTPTAGSNGVVK